MTFSLLLEDELACGVSDTTNQGGDQVQKSSSCDPVLGDHEIRQGGCTCASTSTLFFANVFF